MKLQKLVTISYTFFLALACVVALIWLLAGPTPASADPVNRYVALTGNDAAGPMSPRPSTRVPSLITATVFHLQVSS